jgi:bacterioferritin (cytochrome b1)|tara:strand:+ start:28 stop:282 length:255 start_codon:yes stop_codon:yes gene_type:complete
MDEKIKEILTEKLNHSLNQNEDIEKLIACFENVDNNSFYTGILVGRLYNSFFYQYRRILKKNPSNDEFTEFIDFIKNNLKSFSE